MTANVTVHSSSLCPSAWSSLQYTYSQWSEVEKGHLIVFLQHQGCRMKCVLSWCYISNTKNYCYFGGVLRMRSVPSLSIKGGITLMKLTVWTGFVNHSSILSPVYQTTATHWQPLSYRTNPDNFSTEPVKGSGDKLVYCYTDWIKSQEWASTPWPQTLLQPLTAQL